MLRIILFVVGWLYFVSSVFGMFIRIFGSDSFLATVGLTRNIDVGIYMLIVSFFMLAFIKILFELNDIKKRLHLIDINTDDFSEQKREQKADNQPTESIEQRRKPLVIEPKLNKN